MTDGERRCEICQEVMPANAADEGLGEIDGDPVSLINHRWSVHKVPGITRCEHCAEPMRTDLLANHLLLQHNLPPPDAQVTLRDALRAIEFDIQQVDNRITEVGEELDQKLDDVLRELRPLRADVRSLFWVILAAVVAAELLYPLVKAIVAAALGAVAAWLQ